MILVELDFFQEVEIISENNSIKKYVGCKGVILGKSKNEDNSNVESYGVYFRKLEKVVGFHPDEITPTGIKFKYEDFYDGSYARISPDGELLEVHVINKKEIDG